MSTDNDKRALEEDICVHIFAASAALLGVCLTVIGIIRVIIATSNAMMAMTTQAQRRSAAIAVACESGSPAVAAVLTGRRPAAGR